MYLDEIYATSSRAIFKKCMYQATKDLRFKKILNILFGIEYIVYYVLLRQF